jgi:hypothetical protein
MLNDSENEVHEIWGEQPRETRRITLDEIQAEARRAETRRRWLKTVGTAFFILLVIENCMEAVWPGQNIMERAGDLLIVAALFYIYYEYRKYARVASMPEGLGRTNCLEFYRAHLTYERNLARQSSRYLLPFVPGVTLSLLSGVVDDGVPPARLIGIAIIGVALFLGIAWWNGRAVRKLQKEIDALETL